MEPETKTQSKPRSLLLAVVVFLIFIVSFVYMGAAVPLSRINPNDGAMLVSGRFAHRFDASLCSIVLLGLGVCLSFRNLMLVESMKVFQKYRWGRAGFFVLCIFCAVGTVSTIALLRGFYFFGGLVPVLLIALAAMAEPIVCGIPGVISLCRRERPRWPALACIVAAAALLLMWLAVICEYHRSYHP